MCDKTMCRSGSSVTLGVSGLKWREGGPETVPGTKPFIHRAVNNESTLSMLPEICQVVSVDRIESGLLKLAKLDKNPNLATPQDNAQLLSGIPGRYR